MVTDQAPDPRPSDGSEEPDAHGLPALADEERGGETACWAHLVCPECGSMTTEGHRPGCHASAGDAD